jgi:hypothetical protein
MGPPRSQFRFLFAIIHFERDADLILAPVWPIYQHYSTYIYVLHFVSKAYSSQTDFYREICTIWPRLPFYIELCRIF